MHSDDLSQSPIFTILCIYGGIVFVGVFFNTYVVVRLSKLARKDREQWRNGTGVYLHVMAFCDCCSLFASFGLLFLQTAAFLFSTQTLAATCKAFVITSHFVYTISMYCWLCMSALRYHAARDPLRYSTVCRSPFSVLLIVGGVSFIMNLHVFISVYADENGCAVVDDSFSRLYSFADVMISCLAPSVMILLMDVRVLCFRDRRRHSDPLLQVVFHRPDDEETEKTMRRFMIVTSICLALSLPELSLRAVLALKPSIRIGDAVFFVSKTMYFIKSSFNAFYMMSYVFDRNVLSKTNSSRQLSISARRLEECPAITPRDRAHTVSYRATTPVPLLTRNSSCIGLESNCTTPHSPKQWL